MTEDCRTTTKGYVIVAGMNIFCTSRFWPLAITYERGKYSKHDAVTHDNTRNTTGWFSRGKVNNTATEGSPDSPCWLHAAVRRRSECMHRQRKLMWFDGNMANQFVSGGRILFRVHTTAVYASIAFFFSSAVTPAGWMYCLKPVLDVYAQRIVWCVLACHSSNHLAVDWNVCRRMHTRT